MARRRMARLTRLAVVAGVLAGFTAALPAQAGDDDRPAVLLILDGSGSMNQTDDSGRPLIDLAKEALTSIVQVLPDGQVDVGLRVYGQYSGDAEPEVGCTDSELVVPVGPLDRGQLIDEIDGVQASGYTPIGLSLTEAADDLAGYDTATVILVSDGEDTCAPPDPCEVAEQLAAQGITVNTVGFYLEDGAPARDQLECIAAASGGEYRDADAASDLAGVVGVLLRDVPGIGNFHIPFGGSLDRATAPIVPLTPEDGYVALDTTLSAGETRWMAVEVPAGYVIDVFGDARWFVEAAIPEPGDAFVVTILDPDGRSVGVPGRFGLDRVDLGLFLAVGIDYLQTISVETERLVSSYDEFLEEPWMLEGLEYRGYDEASWNAEQRRVYRYERRGPAPAGTYLIAIAWESELDATATFGYLIGMRTGQTDMYSAPAGLAGSTDPDAPTVLPELPPYDGFPFPAPELDPMAELYGEGPIAPGETRWFSVAVEWDEVLLVDALLAVPQDTTLPPGDTFSIEILDRLGDTVTLPHPNGEPATGMLGELTAYFGQGFEPRPLASAAAREPGPDSPPPGPYRIGVTWESTSDVDDAVLEVRIGTAQPDEMIEMQEMSDPLPIGGEDDSDTQVPAADEPSGESDSVDTPGGQSDDGGWPTGIVVAVVVIAAAVAAAIAVVAWLAARRR